MAKAKDVSADVEVTEEVKTKARKPRKKVYERKVETDIPKELQAIFDKDDYDLVMLRWSIHGDEDYKYMTQRENEGYEFVQADELPEWYLQGVRIMDTRGRKGLVIIGDLCLMKIDKDLRKSREKVFQDIAHAQVESVDVHVLEKRGFRNLGTKSRVTMKEPSFQE